MAKPKLSIELDPGPWKDPNWADYRPAGGVISGRVLVTCDEPTQCRRLSAIICWHTEGRGDTDRDEVLSESLVEGQVPAGQSEHPFSLNLPDEPISYSGHHIKIIWTVTARLDLAWKTDPKAEQVFYVALP